MTTPDTTRRPRSDGIRTRESILHAAAALATTEGLDRLSIGGLADHIGISKSGLFAHFHSKEALQLATIEVAWEMFDDAVVSPALKAPLGMPRLLALVDRYLGHLEGRVFPGGCFFAATSAELHMRPSSITARLDAFYAYWGGHIGENLAAARDAGDLPRDADLEQVAYEIASHLLHAHLAYMPVADPLVLARTGRAIRRLLEVSAEPSGPAPSRSA
jgi:AcrR family transcriptional regulator